MEIFILVKALFLPFYPNYGIINVKIECKTCFMANLNVNLSSLKSIVNLSAKMN